MIAIYIFILMMATASAVIIINRRRQRLELAALQKKSYEELRDTVGKLRTLLKSKAELLVSQNHMMDSMSLEIDALKKNLGKNFPEESYLRMIKIIDEGRENTSDFESMENYFVDVHYEFMQRIQRMHPALTSSELKFCCLIRANLSTKEIAQIMSIEPRSVDLKKYRLKTHLGLDKDENLVKYILKI